MRSIEICNSSDYPIGLPFKLGMSAGRDELLSSRNFRESYIEGCQRDGTNHWPRSNTENEIKRTNDSKVEKENQGSKKYK